MTRERIRELYGVDYLIYYERAVERGKTPLPYKQWLDSICTVVEQ